VAWCEAAADVLLDEYGVAAEVIDLRTIVPLDMDTVVESVLRTGFAVTVQESSGMASMAGELSSQITERCWADLKAPVARVAGLDIPIPYAGPLEARWKPSVDDIVTAVRKLRGVR
jgi:pyruvate dehydrogenase E1 component beta subunit